ncbi:hypothetical protein HMPREF0083_05045 [Aneurinibacillus aneurinilyticus ATCC 12856]|uniref:Uncharacterized protein n=1 Tax=Aneurinibacillus aneurinilyticus ATCC 12856 TaxID=649747 RepID=U1WXE2_ANEAE|nr:hypothetical protein HMPREF0083_05045 [Aneurinibacillus aneurinilyticus ATCC 12856]
MYMKQEKAAFIWSQRRMIGKDRLLFSECIYKRASYRTGR